ncbi:MAG TPA: hypothetical protein VK181_21940, partial [Rhizobium sp.]|nr:hypothetical protein [Rhizobium sp.]
MEFSGPAVLSSGNPCRATLPFRIARRFAINARMRRTVALVSLILGLAALLAATAQLVFLAAGETTEARVAGVAYDDPETEIRYRRRSANTATGYFKLGIDVTYRFDVRPTPAEVLKRGSD